MDDIREWLRGPKNYDAGVKLYLAHGRDEKLKKVFREPVSEFKRGKLFEALKQLATNTAKVEAKVKIEKEIAIERIAQPERKWPKDRDAMLEALHQKWLPKFAEMMNLMSRVYDVALAGEKDVAKKIEAGQMVHRILDLDDECDAIYAKRDYYLKHGAFELEETPIELVVDPIKMPLALANAERYVRQYKNKLKRQPDNVNAAKKLHDYQWAVAQYKKHLKIDVCE
jgi:hypothetical protein